MKQYRPNVERQKWLYSMEKSRILMRRRQGKPPVNMAIAQGKKQIPDNSEPWLPGGVRCMADAIWISDRIHETIKEWQLPQQQQN